MKASSTEVTSIILLLLYYYPHTSFNDQKQNRSRKRKSGMMTEIIFSVEFTDPHAVQG